MNTLDAAVEDEFDRERTYWREVLKRVVSTMKFLTSRGLALRGKTEKIGSEENGKFLGCLELLSKYDPFLAAHVQRYGNAGSGVTSYMSSSTYEEFVKLMADKVRNIIISEIKQTKYFSFSVNSTADVSKVDQLTFSLRYVLDDGQPVERFLLFVPITSHTGRNLYQEILDTFRRWNINIDDCVGQTYDNAANMSKKYNGVQSLIKGVNHRSVYVQCMVYSLNLSGVCAASSCTDATLFFAFVQNLYVFLSASTHRWNTLKEVLEENNKGDSTRILLPKRLSETRWSARADALRSLEQNYKSFRLVLIKLSNDDEQTGETRREASALLKKLNKFETAFMTILWNTILISVNETSKLLQSTSMKLTSAVALLKSLSTFVVVQ